MGLTLKYNRRVVLNLQTLPSSFVVATNIQSNSISINLDASPLWEKTNLLKYDVRQILETIVEQKV